MLITIRTVITRVVCIRIQLAFKQSVQVSTLTISERNSSGKKNLLNHPHLK